MIRTKKEMYEVLEYENKWYSKYMFSTLSRRIMSIIKNEPLRRISKWQKISRKTDYYNYRAHNGGNIIDKLFYLYYISYRNRFGEKLGLEIDTKNIGKGLVIFHYNNVINPASVIGENLHLHGCNVIGNAGQNDLRCPKLGNNIMLGAGAKIIGNVFIADNIKIGAGAVVISSFYEQGITIGGIPAHKLK